MNKHVARAFLDVVCVVGLQDPSRYFLLISKVENPEATVMSQNREKRSLTCLMNMT